MRGISIRAVPRRLGLFAAALFVYFSASLLTAQIDNTTALTQAPSAAQMVPSRLGGFDAITGKGSFSLPLGPRLPGRIPVGFSLNFDGTGLNGSFRPVTWRLGSPYQTPQTAYSNTVSLFGADLTFHNIPAALVPSSASLQGWMSARFVDTGNAVQQLQRLGTQFTSVLSTTLIQDATQATTDGTKFLTWYHWRIVYTIPNYMNPEAGDRTVTTDLPPNCAVINGDQAIFQRDNVTYVTTVWGDKVSITENTITDGLNATFVIQDEVVSANNITLTVTATLPSSGNQKFRAATLSVATSNSLSVLPTATVSGFYLVATRPPTWTGSLSWSGAFLPTSYVATAPDSSSRTTSFLWNWPLAPGFNLNAEEITAGDLGITEMDHPGGFKELFGGGGGPAYGSKCWDSQFGTWTGFKSGNSMSPSGPGFSSIDRVQPDGTGNSTRVYRTVPYGDFDTSNVPHVWRWTTFDQKTLIYSFDRLLSSGNQGTIPYRLTRLTHVSIPGSDTTSKTAFLAYTSAILQSEFIYGAGVGSDGSPQGPNTVSITQYSGWDLTSWINPSDALLYPTTAVATRAQTFTVGLPTRTTLAGDLSQGGRDAYGPTRSDEVLDAPTGLPALMMGTETPVWNSTSNSLTGGAVHRVGKITREWRDSLASLKTLTDHKTLALDTSQGHTRRYTAPNSAQPAQSPTSAVASADFGTTSYTYDTLGRITQQQGDRDGFSAVEVRGYQGNFPLLVSTTKNPLTGPGGPYYPNPDDSSVAAGNTSSWTDTHVQGGPSTVVNKTDGRTESFSYDALGRETSRTDVFGITTNTTYDAWGRKSGVTRLAKGLVGQVDTQITYDLNGHWRDESVTADGKKLTTHTEMDDFGRVVKVTTYDAVGVQATQQSFAYDGFGQKISQSPVIIRSQQSWGNETWAYDGQGRMTDHKDAQGRQLHHVVQQPTWTTINGITAIWTTTQDDQGATRSEAVDLLGQKRAVIDQKNQLTEYFYDQDGHLIQTLQGSGSAAQQRSYTYNAMGWMTSRTEPEEGTTAYSKFNLFGTPLISQQFGRGGSSPRNTFTSVLDAHLHPASVTAIGPEGTVTRNFGYDYGLANTHLLTSLTETSAVTRLPAQSLTETYGYDDLSRLSRKTISDGALSVTVSRVMDAVGNVLSLTYPAVGGRAAETVTVDYDNLRRPRTVKASNSLRGTMGYDDQVSGTTVTSLLTYGNGVTTKENRDKGELVLTEHAVISTNGLMARNPESNAISWTPGGLMLSRGNDAFQYDALQRLTQATVQGLATGEQINQTFGYDTFGNRNANAYIYTPGAGQNSSNRPPEVLAWSASFSNGNDLPATVSTAGGNLSTGAQYDALGRMAQVWAIPGNSAEQATWVYDSSGRVVKETAGGVTATFLLDAAGLRFKRMRADRSLQYTVYGFNQEPLMVLEQVAPIGTTQNLSATKTAPTKTKTVQLLILPRAHAVISQPSGPMTVGPGVPVNFVGTSPDGDTFNWIFGDGGTASGSTASHAFTALGTYTVTLRVADSYGDLTGGNASVVITVAALPTIAGFTASPSSLTLGQSSTLTWATSGATSLSISSVGTVTGTTSTAVTPSRTTTYALTATNAAGSVTASATVTVVPPVISSFTASPSSIILGQSTTLAWGVTGASSLSISGVGAVGGSSLVVTPTATTIYTLTATNASGTVTASATVTVNNPPPPTINAFGASATPINLGGSSTLSWNVSGATALTLNQGIGAVSGTSQVVTPGVTATYTLTASNAWGTATQSVTVTVLPPVIGNFTATPSGITLGKGSTLSWSTSYATSVSISGIGAVGASGSQVVYPTNNTAYILTATSSAGTVTAQVTVALAAPVISSLTASYTRITLGSGTTLSWDVAGASSLNLSPSPGAVTGTSITVFPTTSTTYVLTATNGAGSVTRSITITVDAAPVLLWKKSMIYGFGRLLCEENAAAPTLTYSQSDQVGSPNILTDGSGTVVGRTKNLPFGERFGATGTQSMRRFTNHEDQPGSPIYMQARMYLPAYGKFAQVDPAYDQTKDDPETWNLYNYVTNNPVTKTDPDGRKSPAITQLMVTPIDVSVDTVLYSPDISPPLPKTGSVSTPPDSQPKEINPDGSGKSTSSATTEKKTPEVKTAQTESVGQLLDRKGQEAYEKGNVAGWIGLGFLNAAYQVLTPGGDRLSQVNARAQNGEDVPAKDLAIAGATALGQLALTAAPQLSTSGGSASHVFWSGGTPAKQAAAALAKAEGGVTLEMTAGGRLLDKATTAGNYKYMKPLWDFASRNFANGAEGSVTAVQSMSRGVRVDSIWRSIEYTTLKSSGNPINWYVIP